MNKITKLLSVFIIAGAIGTGVAGIAGCKGGGSNGGGGGGGETTCTHTYNNAGAYEDNGNGTHNKTCDKCGETVPNEACTDGNNDDFCDKCEGDLGSGQATVGITITISETTVIAVEGTRIELTASVANSEDAPTWTVEGTDAANAEIVTEGGKTYLQVKGTATAGMTFTVKATIGDVSKTKTISVTNAPKYYELAHNTNCVLDSAELFATDGAITASPVNGTKGIYHIGSNGATKTEGGLLSTTGGLYIDFGTTGDIIEANLVINVTKSSSNAWTPFRLAGPVGEETTKELFGVKSDGKYRINEKGETPFSGNNYVNNTDYEITFLYNKVTNHLTVKIGQNQEATAYDGTTVDFNGPVTGLSLHAREVADTVTVKKLAVVTYSLEGADYVDAIKENVNALDAEAVALKGTGEWTAPATATTLGDAKSTALAALVETATKEEADGAFATYKTAVLGALAGEYMAKLNNDYPAADYNTSGGEGEPTAYDTAIANAQAALEAVTEIKDYAGVYAAQDALLDAVPTASEEVTAKVTITLYLADGTTEVGKLEDQLDGSTLTIADIKAAAATYLTTNNKKFVDVYKTNTEGVLSEKIESEYAVTAKTDESGNKVDTNDVKLYVDVADWQTAGLDFAAIKTEYDKTADEEGNGGSAISKDDKGNFKIQDVYAKTDESVSGLVKCEAFEFTNSVKSVGIGTASMSPDGTAANETYTYLTPSGNTDASNAYTIVAKKDIVLTITYNTGDSSNVGGKKGKLMYKIGSGDVVTVDVETSSKTQVYTAEIELKAGETLTFYSSASRLIIFGLDAKY